MAKTRLMQVLFSATEEGNEKLTNMVGEDIRTAIKEGKAEDKMNGLSYEHKGEGVVAITDQKTGEVTMANQDPEEESAMELWVPDEQIEGFAHPEGDGVTPGQQEGAPDEHAEEHIEGGSIANQPEEPSVEAKAEGEEVCPECGKNPCECEGHEEGEKHFSIESDNTAIQKVFSKQELIEYVFSEVIESEDTASVGDLKFEKVPDECAVVVTDTKTGHQAKVTLDEDKLRVHELEAKNFNEEGEAAAEAEAEAQEAAPEAQDSIGWFVVGLDAGNHQLVESQEASEEAAAVARDRFVENGFAGVEVFEHLEEAQDYARGLLAHLGAEEEIENENPEIEQHQFSDGSVYATRTFSTHYTDLMYRLFSESVRCDGECPSEAVIKDALKKDEETKVEGDVIVPVRDDLGVIHDTENDEYTKVEIDGDGEVSYEAIDESEANDLIEGEEKTFCNPSETKFFSEHEVMTAYMQRIFSEEASEKEIEEAIEEGNQIEKDGEIITPVDDKTAIIEDKENGEFTKATLSDEEIELHPISEEEADKLTKGLEVEEGEKAEGEKEEKTFCNAAETKFFSESENLTAYMQRLFSDEADEEEIVEVIESGDKKETDEVIITPVDEKIAIIEDKENGEFTKATLEGDEKEVVDVVPVSEEEAKKLIEGEKSEEAHEEEAAKEEAKEFSTLDKFFSANFGGAAAPAADGSTVQEVRLMPGQSIVVLDENGQPVEQPAEEEEAPSVEVIEDKALAAVQAIQEATEAAAQAIQEAKAAPAEGQEAQLQEAQFSEQKTFSETDTDPLLSWLKGNKIG